MIFNKVLGRLYLRKPTNIFKVEGLVLLFLTQFHFFCFSQEVPQKSIPKEIKSFSLQKDIIDLLTKNDYKEIQEQYYKNQRDSVIAGSFANVYILKAKKNWDTIEIANGYHLQFKLHRKNSAIAFKYVDSIIDLTKNTKSYNYPSRGYLNKGNLLKESKRLKESLSHYLLAEKHAIENNNIPHQLSVKFSIGRLKNVLNKNEDALNDFKDNVSFLEKNNLEEKNKTIYLRSLLSISDTYNRLKIVDSASKYIEYGMNLCSDNEHKYEYTRFLLFKGINQFQNKKYNKALETLLKSKALISHSEKEINYAICRLYIAKCLNLLNRENEAAFYLKQIDSFTTPSNYRVEVREGFEMLIDHCEKSLDKDNQLRLLRKLILLDSISSYQDKNLSIDLIKEEDTKKLKASREELIKKFGNKEKNYFIYIFLISATTLIVVILFIYLYIAYKKSSQNKDTKNVMSINKPVKDLEIPQNIIEDLSQKLKVFEKDKKFTSSNISLVNVAKSFKTNSTYLSKVINTTTDKNFTNYINDLRIEFVMRELKDNPKFRKYSINAIAKEAGFNNIKSFSRAFTKKTGVLPSFYIKSL